MIELTRDQAELLFSESHVLKSRIEPITSGFKVIIELDDSRYFFVHYNTKNHQKTYFIDKAESSPPVKEY